LRLNPLMEGFPWDDLRKSFNECQRMAKVPNGIEILPKISNSLSRAHERYRWQTYGLAIAYSERERERAFTFAKNDEVIISQTFNA